MCGLLQVARCWAIIQRNFAKLKDLFIALASRSNFPSIGIINFCSWCDKCDVMDKSITIATIDRLFIASNYEVEKNDDNPDKELCRFEFMEILLRIANAKFRETGIT